MFNTLLSELISQTKIEAVKLQMQICVPSREKKQKNDVLGNIFIEEFDAETLLYTIKTELKNLEKIKTIETFRTLYDNWNHTRLKIQFAGYGWGDSARLKAGKAIGYLFMERNVKAHDELYNYLQQVKQKK